MFCSFFLLFHHLKSRKRCGKKSQATVPLTRKKWFNLEFIWISLNLNLTLNFIVVAVVVTNSVDVEVQVDFTSLTSSSSSSSSTSSCISSPRHATPRHTTPYLSSSPCLASPRLYSLHLTSPLLFPMPVSSFKNYWTTISERAGQSHLTYANACESLFSSRYEHVSADMLPGSWSVVTEIASLLNSLKTAMPAKKDQRLRKSSRSSPLNKLTSRPVRYDVLDTFFLSDFASNRPHPLFLPSCFQLSNQIQMSAL